MLLTALALAGHVVLLLWGTRTVQNGVERAFGSDLRRLLGQALRNRLVAMGAGAGVTMLLQSSTATAMMATSFAARGALELVPALAVMLGANVGTALIVRLLSFDVSWLAPLLMLAGYIAFRRAPKGRVRHLGRVGVGLGLMLLALHEMTATLQSSSVAASQGGLLALVAADPMLREFLRNLTADPITDLLIAAAVTYVAHSSVAAVLLLASLAAGGALSPVAALAMVLGANLGGALPPVLEIDASNPTNRRVPAGNLMFRAIGCLLVLPFLRPLSALISAWQPDPLAAVTLFHLGFNLMLAVFCVGWLRHASALLTRMFPTPTASADTVGQPLFLDSSALETPYLALSAAAREMLRMGDLVEALLALVPQALGRRNKLLADQAGRLGLELDRLHAAVKAYLSRLDRGELTPQDARRLTSLLEFAVNLGQAGGLLDKRIGRIAGRETDMIADPDQEAVHRLLAGVTADLRLAMSTMLTEDTRSADELRAAKRVINDAERAAVREHLGRLGQEAEAQQASGLFLGLLHDLKLVNSHLASIGYTVPPPEPA